MEIINERLLRVGKQIVALVEEEHLPAAAFIYLLDHLHRSAIEAMMIVDLEEDVANEPIGLC